MNILSAAPKADMFNKKAKEPLIALMLTNLLPGLGHVYSDSVKKGIVFFSVNIAATGGALAYFLSPVTEIYPYMLIFIPICFIFEIYVLIDSYLSAGRYNQKHSLERKITGTRKAGLIAAIIFVSFFNPRLYQNYIRSNVVQAFRLPSSTMEPVIMKGDRVLADKFAYKNSPPERGDIVVFQYPKDSEKIFVKRVVAFGGESVEIKGGDVYINGTLVMDPKIKNITYYNHGDFGKGEVKVPENHNFMLGDNSASSNDSRYWGFVPDKYVIGKVYKIYYPFERSGPVE
jgi:signal peptidase I